jgi:hypothetical protein
MNEKAESLAIEGRILTDVERAMLERVMVVMDDLDLVVTSLVYLSIVGKETIMFRNEGRNVARIADDVLRKLRSQYGKDAIERGRKLVQETTACLGFPEASTEPESEPRPWHGCTDVDGHSFGDLDGRVCKTCRYDLKTNTHLPGRSEDQ